MNVIHAQYSVSLSPVEGVGGSSEQARMYLYPPQVRAFDVISLAREGSNRERGSKEESVQGKERKRERERDRESQLL